MKNFGNLNGVCRYVRSTWQPFVWRSCFQSWHISYLSWILRPKNVQKNWLSVRKIRKIFYQFSHFFKTFSKLKIWLLTMILWQSSPFKLILHAYEFWTKIPQTSHSAYGLHPYLLGSLRHFCCILLASTDVFLSLFLILNQNSKL